MEAMAKPSAQSRPKNKPISLPYAFRSFVGHLEGTQKAAHTIGSYKSDLATFQKFLEKGLSTRAVKLEQVTTQDLKRYGEFLSGMGLKTNTRRRKLLTVRRFLKYLSKRKKLRINPAEQMPAPYKVERIPVTVDIAALGPVIRALPTESVIQRRNRVLLWTLTETGCLVSEAANLRYSQWANTPDGAVLRMEGKAPRTIPVSPELMTAIEELKPTEADGASDPHIFGGFNKFGPLGGSISPRGIELLVKHHSTKLGFPELTPRTIRHSCVIFWHREGLKQEEIQLRLGLKTAYAFRVYQPLFKKQTDKEPSDPAR